MNLCLKREENSELTAAAAHQREKEIKLSQVGLIIVGGLFSYYLQFKNNETFLVFIVCHSIKWIPNIYELLQMRKEKENFAWPPWIRKFIFKN